MISHTRPLICDSPFLEGRMARCGDHAIKPSSRDLAFFEYLGPGSKEAAEACGTCGFYEVAHRPGVAGPCERFVARGPAEFDRHYCGCRGWD